MTTFDEALSQYRKVEILSWVLAGAQIVILACLLIFLFAYYSMTRRLEALEHRIEQRLEVMGRRSDTPMPLQQQIQKQTQPHQSKTP